MSNSNVKCDHSDFSMIFDFIDQEQCELLFHTQNQQTKMLLANRASKDILSQMSENEKYNTYAK